MTVNASSQNLVSLNRATRLPSAAFGEASSAAVGVTGRSNGVVSVSCSTTIGVG